jgi:hypothetical protein
LSTRALPGIEMQTRGETAMAESARSKMPTFNHVAMSLPASLLDDAGCRDILRFYEEVFGFTEMPSMTESGERLVLRAHSNEQFVYLIADPEPMTCPKGDHFGMSVATPDELYSMLERARKFAESDDRVEIVEPTVEDFKVLKLHNFYVRYLMPMMLEVQCFDWAEGAGPGSLPEA